MTNNGQSVVDYGIVSESLLSSVKYFKNSAINYLSDHTQLQIFLRCNWNNEIKNISDKEWTNSISYKWDTKKSKLKLINYLSTKTTINEIVNFEMKQYSQNQEGVDEAINDFNNILDSIAKKFLCHSYASTKTEN